MLVNDSFYEIRKIRRERTYMNRERQLFDFVMYYWCSCIFGDRVQSKSKFIAGRLHSAAMS
jgi:hypothetical protein